MELTVDTHPRDVLKLLQEKAPERDGKVLPNRVVAKEDAGEHRRQLRAYWLDGGKTLRVDYELVGPAGAVNLALMIVPDLAHKMLTVDEDGFWAIDLGTHERQFNPNKWHPDEGCHVLDGAMCSYSGTSLGAMRMWEDAEHDVRHLWTSLQAYYIKRFVVSTRPQTVDDLDFDELLGLLTGAKVLRDGKVVNAEKDPLTGVRR